MESWEENYEHTGSGEALLRPTVDLLLYQIQEISVCGETKQSTTVARFGGEGSVHFSRTRVDSENNRYSLQVYDCSGEEKPLLAIHFMPGSDAPRISVRMDVADLDPLIAGIFEDLEKTERLTGLESVVMQNVLLDLRSTDKNDLCDIGDALKQAIAEIIDDEKPPTMRTSTYTYTNSSIEITADYLREMKHADADNTDLNEQYSLKITDKKTATTTILTAIDYEVYIEDIDTTLEPEFTNTQPNELNPKQVEDISLYLSDMFRGDLKNRSLEWQNRYMCLLDNASDAAEPRSEYAYKLWTELLIAKHTFRRTLQAANHLQDFGSIEKAEPELERLFLNELAGINSIRISLDMFTFPDFNEAVAVRPENKYAHVQYLNTRFLDARQQRWTDPRLPTGMYLQVMMPVIFADGRRELQKVNIPYDKMKILQFNPVQN